MNGSQPSPATFPDYSLFARVCGEGLSVVRPMSTLPESRASHWDVGAMWPPSYGAFARMRYLLALREAQRLGPRRSLEIAAGDGALSACLAAAGCDVVANDLRADALVRSLRNYSTGAAVRVESGSVFELTPERIGQFDLITACEIIEHVAHPRQLLEGLRGLLAPDGRLLLTTPNGDYWRRREPTYSQVQNEDRLESRQFGPGAADHLFVLTPRELCALATDAGFNVEKLYAWGAPTLTGFHKLRRFRGPAWVRPAYRAELIVQRIPVLKRRLVIALTAVLQA